uniref:Piezo-type mechanosensitive ion channel component 2-like n=1 Tax=Petromyzon marinus TaxID=7757 RepID=A0AAJ7WKR2_PETMA
MRSCVPASAACLLRVSPPRVLAGHTGRLVKAICCSSFLFLCLHLCFQATIAAFSAQRRLDHTFNCTYLETLSRHIGFVRVHEADWPSALRLFAPEFGVFAVGFVAWFLCWKLTCQPDARSPCTESPGAGSDQVDEEAEAADLDEDDAEGGDEADDEYEEEGSLAEGGAASDAEGPGGLAEEPGRREIFLARAAAFASRLKELIGKIITTAGKVVATVMLGLAGVIVPSLTSLAYFVLFMALCSWWACGRSMPELAFGCVCVATALFSAGHLLGLYIYQMPALQELVPPGDLNAR